MLFRSMAERLEVSGDDLLSEMRGVAAIRPRPKFVGAFLPRKANLQGYLKDPAKVYIILWDRVQRKRFLEPFTKQATDLLSKIKTPWLRVEMEEYIKSVGGKYIEPSYLLGINLSKLSTQVVRIQSKLKLGYRPSTALLNRLQAFQTAWSELGNDYFKAEAKRLTPEGRRIADLLNLKGHRPKFATGGFGERGMGREELYKPLGMFSKAERAVREAAGIGAIDRAIARRFNLKEAIEYGQDVISATQYRYDVSDLPKIFRHPVGRMAFQFKTFPINYVVNAYYTLTLRPLPALEKYEARMFPTLASKIARAARFLGANMSVGGLRTIHYLITPYSSGGILTYLAIRHPEVFKGAFHYAGIDLSERAGASPFDIIPREGWDLLGLPAGDIQRIYKAIMKFEKLEDPKDLLEIMKICPEAWAIYRSFAEEEGVQPTQYERLLTALGFDPTRLSDIRRGMTYIHYTTPEMRTKALYLPTETALQNMVYYVTQHKEPAMKADESERQYQRRLQKAEKRKQVCLEILKDAEITTDEQYRDYLFARKKRLG